MGNSGTLQNRNCPYCGLDQTTLWTTENDFKVVTCNRCQFFYLNPAPDQITRDNATELGVHSAADDLDISERFVRSKVQQYRKILASDFADIWKKMQPVSWLDIGSGYGEVMESIAAIAHKDSKVIGLEPMTIKAQAATKRGLDVIQSFIGPETPKVEFISLINVFSHVYDFDTLLQDIHNTLLPDGELFIETGDFSNIKDRNTFPGELGLPDHVAFATLSHIEGFLERNGFEVVKSRTAAIDTVMFSIKNVVKKIIGRNVRLMMPYTSPYRTLYVRARKLSQV